MKGKRALMITIISGFQRYASVWDLPRGLKRNPIVSSVMRRLPPGS